MTREEEDERVEPLLNGTLSELELKEEGESRLEELV